ncbi:MAG: hypothetical protein LBD50_02300, partial [Rickettsiales bacterium]|nr:hypothetical protein [Rickettsiales bacterium]
RVEFIGGLWRVQNKFNYNISEVRGQKFVLDKKLTKEDLAQEEIKFFDYYQARIVYENCYGPMVSDTKYIVANFRRHWSYGNNISDARAFLAVRVLDYYLGRAYSIFEAAFNKLRRKK